MLQSWRSVQGVYGGYICYIGFFVLKTTQGGNTARVPCRPDPRTGVRFLRKSCWRGLRRGPLTRRCRVCSMRGYPPGAGGILKKFRVNVRKILNTS